MDPDDVKQLSKNQRFHAAVIDSSTITDTTTLIATLRSLPAAKRIVVVTTALGWRQARAVYQAGAYDYRFKSYDVQELEQMIKNFFKLDEAGESNTEVPES
jgi:DNA-binding NtrC family response regulator